MARITVATTIAPRRISLQQEAILSWQNAGFEVLSVNSPEEIRELSPKFPHVRFVEAPRDGSGLYGKPFVFLDDILEILGQTDTELCGIINSDIVIGQGEEFFKAVSEGARDALVACVRTDVNSLECCNGEKSAWGYDAFFFPCEYIPLYPRSEFCLGLPVWDYWVPLIPLLLGRKVRLMEEPRIYHVIHEVVWQSTAPQMLRKLVNYLQAGSLRGAVESVLGGAINVRVGNTGIIFISTLVDLCVKCNSESFCGGGVDESRPSLATQERQSLFAGFLKSSSYLIKETQELNNEISRMQTSMSWRLSRPIRALWMRVRSLFFRG